jgi:hypothetical protein
MISERFDLLSKLCALQLSALEWKQMRNWNLRKTLREVSQWREEKFLSLSDRKILEARVQSAVKFYTSAQERDQLLAENCLKWIEKQKLDQAAIIVGGFHSDALAKELVEEGITVVVMTPRIHAAGDYTKYLEIMSGKKTLLDRILGDPGQDAFNAEIKIQLHLPFSSTPAQEVIPPLRLAQAHAALRNALEEKALFLTFLNFLYFEAKGPSFLREIERFKDELKKSYIKNLEEELEENEIPPANRTGFIENAMLHLDHFFKSLHIQNIDKKGSILKVHGRFGGEGFEVDVLQDPLDEIPTSLRDTAETGELKEGSKWFLKPYGIQDPHWLEVREVIAQDSFAFANLPRDLSQRIWAQDSVSLETIKKHNPDLFKGYNPELFKGRPNSEAEVITPVICIEEKDGKKIYRVLAGAKTLLHQSRDKQYYTNAWVGKIRKPEDRLIDEYQTWEKSRFAVGSFDSSIKTRIEMLFGLLEESQTVPDSDEFLYTILRKTVFSDIPSDVQEIIIEGLRKESWISDWTSLERMKR